jgi:hypothetical protein
LLPALLMLLLVVACLLLRGWRLGIAVLQCGVLHRGDVSVLRRWRLRVNVAARMPWAC